MKGYIQEMRRLIGSRPMVIVGSTVLVENEEGRLLFQFRTDTREWGLPGGALEPGETLEETAQRELKEETGLHAATCRQIATLSGEDFYYRYPNGDEVYNIIAVFLATRVNGDLKVDDEETLDLKYFPLDDLPRELDGRAQLILERVRAQ